jgi:hypothetical protein
MEYPGYLVLGEGFWKPHADIFQKLNGLVENIWITACRVASRSGLSAGEKRPPNLKGQIGDGYEFCRNIAINASCNGIASMNDQDVPKRRIPDGCVDAWMRGCVDAWMRLKARCFASKRMGKSPGRVGTRFIIANNLYTSDEI